MAVIFPRWTNHLPLVGAVAGVLGGLAVVGLITYYFSPAYTDVGYAPEQPVEFSHRLHAGELGLDCRYCHNTVEYAARAAIPPTSTCMNCHRVVKADSDKLAKVRDSAASGKPLEWVRVHMLPDYTFFDHSVHVAAGVGCATCHGRIDQMDVVAQQAPLSMGWCLDCHRDPTPNLRPRSEVTNMAWDNEAGGYNSDSGSSGRKPTPPEHCSGCHR